MKPRPNVRIKVPPQVKRGEPFEIRAMILHPMNTGFDFNTQGTRIPIHIIYRFVCRYNGREIFRAELGTGVAANPYFSFYATASESGTLEFTWHDDDGSVYSETTVVEVA